MFCPSCGAESSPGLSYCNRCGISLNPAAIAPPAVYTRNLILPILALSATLAGITLGGLAIIIAGASRLAFLQNNDPIKALIILGLTTILVTDVMLLRQLSKLIGGMLSPTPRAGRTQATLPPQRAAAQMVEEARWQMAAGAPDYVSSVTENTTRTLQSQLRGPNTQG